MVADTKRGFWTRGKIVWSVIIFLIIVGLSILGYFFLTGNLTFFAATLNVNVSSKFSYIEIDSTSPKVGEVLTVRVNLYESAPYQKRGEKIGKGVKVVLTSHPPAGTKICSVKELLKTPFPCSVYAYTDKNGVATFYMTASKKIDVLLSAKAQVAQNKWVTITNDKAGKIVKVSFLEPKKVPEATKTPTPAPLTQEVSARNSQYYAFVTSLFGQVVNITIKVVAKDGQGKTIPNLGLHVSITNVTRQNGIPDSYFQQSSVPYYYTSYSEKTNSNGEAEFSIISVGGDPGLEIEADVPKEGSLNVASLDLAAVKAGRKRLIGLKNLRSTLLKECSQGESNTLAVSPNGQINSIKELPKEFQFFAVVRIPENASSSIPGQASSTLGLNYFVQWRKGKEVDSETGVLYLHEGQEYKKRGDTIYVPFGPLLKFSADGDAASADLSWDPNSGFTMQATLEDNLQTEPIQIGCSVTGHASYVVNLLGVTPSGK